MAQAYLTTKELAELLRIKERKVYDLAASGEVPCTRAMGKLLFPQTEIEAWLAAHRSGPAPAFGAEPRPAVFLGSQDPLLEWALRESRSGIATFFDGSSDGLERFAAGEGIATGLHLRDEESGVWNAPAAAARCGGTASALVGWGSRRRGLILGDGAAARVRGLGDLAGLRVATRQPQAGAEQLFRALLAEVGGAPEQWAAQLEARSETDAAQAVAEGRADACFGLEAVAAPYRLAFAPVLEERFDLLVDRRAWFEPPLQKLWAFCRSEAFQARAAATPGYDASELGVVRWLGP